jgi:UDP-N-acetylmuramyl tripeptide synthase
MNIRLIITIAVAKIIIKACRLFKRGGTALAGKVALKIYPDVIRVLAKNFKIIMVTGTNGKTTTVRIIGQILKENRLKYITNKSGANLASGIATTFLDSVNFFGNCVSSIALLEIDEAAFGAIDGKINPYILVVTNFFKDQLDRHGKLYSLLKGIRQGIEKMPKTKLVLNADDSLCVSLSKDTNTEVLFFGMDNAACSLSENRVFTDASFCLYCKSKYEYTNYVYGHLGGFKCPQCGYSRPDSQVTCLKVEKRTSSYSQILMEVKQPDAVPSTVTAKVNMPGVYNIYNALGAAACGIMLELPLETITDALSSFESGFGRMETIDVGSRSIKITLVKNPTGFNQVLDLLVTGEDKMNIAFVINDKEGDGKDVSWLWDVNFEKLRHIQNRINNFYTSGTRALDMAVRLKYADIPVDKINIINDYDKLINAGASGTDENLDFYILPTYTALLDIRKVLVKKYKLKEFWK